MRRVGLVLVVAGLTAAAWLLGRSAGRAAVPPPPAAQPLVAESPRPYRLRLISRADGRPVQGVPVTGDDRDLGTTDADGQLVVAADDTIHVRVPGFVPETALFDGHTTWVELTPGVPVTGVVVDERTRTPVAGAFISRWEPGKDSWDEHVESDANGRFGITAPVGQPFDIEVSGRGFADVVERHVTETPLRDLEIVVGKGGVLEGVVTLADGASPDRRVALLLVPAEPPGGEAGQTYFETDVDGRFRLRGVTPGIDWCVVTFREEGGRSDPVRFEHDGESNQCNIRIPEPASLTVRIEAPEAPPHPDEEDVETLVRVHVESDDDRPGAPKLIGGQEWGEETAFDLPPGAVKVTVTIEGWPTVERRVVLGEGEAREEVFRFAGGETLAGILLDVDGTPDGEALRCVGRGFEAECKPDADGRFEIHGLPRGPATLVAGWSETATVVWRGDVPAKGSLVARRPRAALLMGRIAGTTGPGPLRVTVEADEAWYAVWPFLLEGGRFVVEVAAVGEPLILALSLDDFAAPAVFALPPLRPGEVRDLGEIRLDNGRAVRGVVLGPDGQPVPGADVVVLEAWSDAAARTDAHGRFTLIRMPPKPLWVRIRAGEIPSHTVRIDDGATIRLGPGGMVMGTGPVTVTPQGDEWLERRYAETAIELPAMLQAGNYRATFEDGQTADLVVRDGETTPALR